MTKKRKFATTHNLKFNTMSSSTIDGLTDFNLFSMGGVAGMFRVRALSVDVLLTEVKNTDHMTDVIEWFDEVARLGDKIGVTINGLIAPDLIDICRNHGFAVAGQNLFKQNPGYLKTVKSLNRQMLKSAKQSGSKSKMKRAKIATSVIGSAIKITESFKNNDTE